MDYYDRFGVFPNAYEEARRQEKELKKEERRREKELKKQQKKLKIERRIRRKIRSGKLKQSKPGKLKKSKNGKYNKCSICMDKDIEVVFAPCSHQATCAECSQRLDRCPICRQDIAQKIIPIKVGAE